jgi:DNA adenine methylase
VSSDEREALRLQDIIDNIEIRTIFAGFKIAEVGLNYRLSGRMTPARELIVSGPR